MEKYVCCLFFEEIYFFVLHFVCMYICTCGIHLFHTNLSTEPKLVYTHVHSIKKSFFIVTGQKIKLMTQCTFTTEDTEDKSPQLKSVLHRILKLRADSQDA